MSLYPVDLELFKIKDIRARQILDSRANPTIEVEVVTEGGGVGLAAAPSGASTGTHEALERRDRDDKRFRGKGVYSNIKIVEETIKPNLLGKDARRQREIDYIMIKLDGTPQKTKLGGNTILATSLAVAKAAADTYGMPLFRYLGGVNAHVLPVPMMNIINGGKHAGNELAIQEFMIVPAGADKFSEAIRIAAEVYYALKDYLKSKYGKNAINVGDEGGFAPPMKKTTDALDALLHAISEAGYDEKSVVIAMDAAASEFFDESKKVYKIDDKELAPGELLDFYIELVEKYPIVSIEDPFHEEDFEMFAKMTEKIGNKILIVGDDLFVTNPKRLQKGFEFGAANAILIKPNQIGTLTETLDVIRMAKEHAYRTIVSHRSGETEDTTISDIAVGMNTGLIKTGAPARGERTAKYNRLIRIEEYLGSEAEYLGFKVFKRKF